MTDKLQDYRYVTHHDPFDPDVVYVDKQPLPLWTFDKALPVSHLSD